MKTLYKYLICVMLLLLGSMNMAWASIESYPKFNASDGHNTAKWISEEGCFEFKLLTHDDQTWDVAFVHTDKNGWVKGGELSVNAIKVGSETKSGFKFLNFAETGEWYVNCSDPNNGAYGPVYVKNGTNNSWTKLTSTTDKYSTTKLDRYNYAIVRWYPKKTIQGVYLDKGIKIQFKAYLEEWARKNDPGDAKPTRYSDDIEITHYFLTDFVSKDWQIDGSWGYNLSLFSLLGETNDKYWNIAYVTPTGQPSQWVEFSAQGISTANVSNGTFDLARYITNNGTIQMYTRVYPHLNDSYSSSDPFFYDVASSTISVKNRTLTWNNVEDGNVKFYYNDQQATLTKGQNVPKGTYDVEIGSECPPSAKFDNVDLVANGNKFPFSVNTDGQHTLVLTGKEHVHVADAYVAPTCTEIGYTAGDHCSVCNQILTVQNEITALGHDHENYKCTRCGDIDAALGGLCGYNEGTITNGYSSVLDASRPVANQNLSGAKSVRSEQLASGEIAYRLNEGQDATVWYQTIGEDAIPVFNSGSKVVYAVEHKDTLYINEGTTVPEYTLYDGYDFRTPVTFCAGNASYGRTMRSTWGTIVLPFAIDYTADNGEIQFYYLSGMNEDALVFSQFEDGVIPAGTPMVVKKLVEGDELIIESANTEISGTLSPLDYNNLFTKMSLFGTFVSQNYDVKNQDSGRQFYYISNNLFWHATGTIKLNPFRAMFELSTTMANPSFSASSARFSICEEEDFANGIESLNSDRFEEGTLYDLSGRKTDDIKQGEVYMLNGQKVIFK